MKKGFQKVIPRCLRENFIPETAHIRPKAKISSAIVFSVSFIGP